MVRCYGPNCGRIFDRIVTVGIRGEFWLFGRTVENSGEAGVDGAELTARQVGAASKSRSPREESDRRRGLKLLRREDMENKEVERQRIARHRTPWDSW